MGRAPRIVSGLSAACSWVRKATHLLLEPFVCTAPADTSPRTRRGSGREICSLLATVVHVRVLALFVWRTHMQHVTSSHALPESGAGASDSFSLRSALLRWPGLDVMYLPPQDTCSPKTHRRVLEDLAIAAMVLCKLRHISAHGVEGRLLLEDGCGTATPLEAEAYWQWPKVPRPLSFRCV